MVIECASPVLETVARSVHRAGRLGDPVLAGDNLTDLGLSRLRLLGVLIELEDKYDIEFPTEAIDNFLVVSDIALYIQSRQMMPYDDDDDATERTVVTTHPIDQRRFAHGRARRVCVHVLDFALGLVRLFDGSRLHSFRRPNQALVLRSPVAYPPAAWGRPEGQRL